MTSGGIGSPAFDTESSNMAFSEDEFLIRMDAADMVKSAGFEVVEAESKIALISPSSLPRSKAGFHGWLETGRRHKRPLAANQDRCHLRVPENHEDDLPAGSRLLPKP